MRIDLDIISEWVKPESRVLDLACGDGLLLQQLKRKKGVSGYGLEIDHAHINECISKGLSVIDQDLDERGLGNFRDASFDTVIMTQALQTMRYPDKMVEEMLRIGRECIVTFPNFGHWKARLYLLFKGRMPVSDMLPYEWYDTPNIHFCTFRDFEILCRQRGIKIKRRLVVTSSFIDRLAAGVLPNLFGATAIYHLG
ncbi:methionine biosynthesis protein MetW [Halioxenophilus sp. WMMB6]|uniref:methionine biosynthesis protein MetW n=1 Tax=Halioxenophilus sp. WMMB6 TaxID=3073815 RepID=UPI00295EDC85|nr:methionine biosynthesis protein MetW [Halioxenophilus sp. WMMB6]